MKNRKALLLTLLTVTSASCYAATNDLQTTISKFPKVMALEYRPDEAVGSANVLIAAGEEAACSALQDAARPKEGENTDSSANEKVCHLCRLLFEPRNAGQPLRPPVLGVSLGLPHYSLDPSDWPDLPFAIVDNVPLSMNLGYGLAGRAEKAEDYLAYCMTNGSFRTKPFPKTTYNAASSALSQIFESARWKALRWQDNGPGWRYDMDEAYAKERLRKQVDNMKRASTR